MLGWITTNTVLWTLGLLLVIFTCIRLWYRKAVGTRLTIPGTSFDSSQIASPVASSEGESSSDGPRTLDVSATKSSIILPDQRFNSQPVTGEGSVFGSSVVRPRQTLGGSAAAASAAAAATIKGTSIPSQESSSLKPAKPVTTEQTQQQEDADKLDAMEEKRRIHEQLKERYIYLTATQILSNMTLPEFKLLYPLLTWRQYPRGTILWRQGDNALEDGKGLCILAEGALAAYCAVETPPHALGERPVSTNKGHRSESFSHDLIEEFGDTPTETADVELDETVLPLLPPGSERVRYFRRGEVVGECELLMAGCAPWISKNFSLLDDEDDQAEEVGSLMKSQPPSTLTSKERLTSIFSDSSNLGDELTLQVDDVPYEARRIVRVNSLVAAADTTLVEISPRVLEAYFRLRRWSAVSFARTYLAFHWRSSRTVLGGFFGLPEGLVNSRGEHASIAQRRAAMDAFAETANLAAEATSSGDLALAARALEKLKQLEAGGSGLLLKGSSHSEIAEEPAAVLNHTTAGYPLLKSTLHSSIQHYLLATLGDDMCKSFGIKRKEGESLEDVNKVFESRLFRVGAPLSTIQRALRRLFSSKVMRLFLLYEALQLDQPLITRPTGQKNSGTKSSESLKEVRSRIQRALSEVAARHDLDTPSKWKSALASRLDAHRIRTLNEGEVLWNAGAFSTGEFYILLDGVLNKAIPLHHQAQFGARRQNEQAEEHALSHTEVEAPEGVNIVVHPALKSPPAVRVLPPVVFDDTAIHNEGTDEEEDDAESPPPSETFTPSTSNLPSPTSRSTKYDNECVGAKLLTSGAVVGALSFFSESSHSTTVTAVTPCTLLRLTRADFDNAARPTSLVLLLTQLVTQRLVHAVRDATALGIQTVRLSAGHTVFREGQVVTDMAVVVAGKTRSFEPTDLAITAASAARQKAALGKAAEGSPQHPISPSPSSGGVGGHSGPARGVGAAVRAVRTGLMNVARKTARRAKKVMRAVGTAAVRAAAGQTGRARTRSPVDDENSTSRRSRSKTRAHYLDDDAADMDSDLEDSEDDYEATDPSQPLQTDDTLPGETRSGIHGSILAALARSAEDGEDMWWTFAGGNRDILEGPFGISGDTETSMTEDEDAKVARVSSSTIVSPVSAHSAPECSAFVDDDDEDTLRRRGFTVVKGKSLLEDFETEAEAKSNSNIIGSPLPSASHNQFGASPPTLTIPAESPIEIPNPSSNERLSAPGSLPLPTGSTQSGAHTAVSAATGFRKKSRGHQDAGVGECVGEVPFLLNEPVYDSTCVCLRETVLATISRGAFHMLRDRQPKVALRLSRALALRLSRMSKLSASARHRTEISALPTTSDPVLPAKSPKHDFPVLASLSPPHTSGVAIQPSNPAQASPAAVAAPIAAQSEIQGSAPPENMVTIAASSSDDSKVSSALPADNDALGVTGDPSEIATGPKPILGREPFGPLDTGDSYVAFNPYLAEYVPSQPSPTTPVLIKGISNSDVNASEAKHPQDLESTRGLGQQADVLESPQAASEAATSDGLRGPTPKQAVAPAPPSQTALGTGPPTASRCITLCIVPTNPRVSPNSTLKFAEALAVALELYGPAVVVSAPKVREALGPDTTSKLYLQHERARVASYFTHLERTHRFVVYVAEHALSLWSKLVVRSADRLYLLAWTTGETRPPSYYSTSQAAVTNGSSAESVGFGDPRMTIYESKLVWSRIYQSRRHSDVPIDLSTKELVLLHPHDTELPSGTRHWLRLRRCHDFHHVRLGSHEHMQRLARRIAGRATGLVLSGGGARGLAHIGAARAMKRTGIPYDFIAGTSQGALVGALMAQWPDDAGMVDKQTRVLAAKLGSISGLLSDATLPVMSYFAGRQFGMNIQAVVGSDTRIEDTWIPFFCVSTNVSTADIAIHRFGSLWRAVRASMTLLGYLPPMNHIGELLIDGGYINNLPVDAMRDIHKPYFMIAVDIENKDYAHLSNVTPYGDYLNGFWLLWKKLQAWMCPKPKNHPDFFHIPKFSEIIDALVYINHNKNVRQFVASRMMDLYIRPDLGSTKVLDYHKCDSIVEIGFNTSLPLCERFKALYRHHFPEPTVSQAASMIVLEEDACDLRYTKPQTEVKA